MTDFVNFVNRFVEGRAKHDEMRSFVLSASREELTDAKARIERAQGIAKSRLDRYASPKNKSYAPTKAFIRATGWLIQRINERLGVLSRQERQQNNDAWKVIFLEVVRSHVGHDVLKQLVDETNQRVIQQRMTRGKPDSS